MNKHVTNVYGNFKKEIAVIHHLFICARGAPYTKNKKEMKEIKRMKDP